VETKVVAGLEAPPEDGGWGDIRKIWIDLCKVKLNQKHVIGYVIVLIYFLNCPFMIFFNVVLILKLYKKILSAKNYNNGIYWLVQFIWKKTMVKYGSKP